MAGTHFELVVTLDGGSDGSAKVLAGLTQMLPVRVLTQARSGPAAGRNRAMAVASGDVLVFLDDDVIPQPGLIERHLAVHSTDPDAVVLGPMLPPSDNDQPAWLRWEATTLRKQYDAMVRGEYAPTPRQFYTANASVRRSHALAVGGFDESFKRAEDVEFAYRLADRGLRFHFLQEAAVVHEPVRTWEGWLDVAREYGRHAVIFQRDRGRDQLRLAYEEWPERHPLNRWLAEMCVGHRHRSKALSNMAGLAVRRNIGKHWDRVQMGLCSAAYSAAYWQGVADESGLGKKVWARG
jgi:GT2 family glycosyltransferase